MPKKPVVRNSPKPNSDLQRKNFFLVELEQSVHEYLTSRFQSAMSESGAWPYLEFKVVRPDSISSPCFNLLTETLFASFEDAEWDWAGEEK